MTYPVERGSIERFDYTPTAGSAQQIAFSYNLNLRWPASFSDTFGDPDYCIARNLFGGVKIETRVLLQGEEQSSWEECANVSGVNFDSENRTYGGEAPAPATAGAWDLTVEVRRRSDGALIDSQTVSVDVRDTAEVPNRYIPDGFNVGADGDVESEFYPDDGNNSGDSEDANGPGETIDDLTNIALLGIVAWGLSSASDLFGDD